MSVWARVHGGGRALSGPGEPARQQSSSRLGSQRHTPTSSGSGLADSVGLTMPVPSLRCSQVPTR